MSLKEDDICGFSFIEYVTSKRHEAAIAKLEMRAKFGSLFRAKVRNNYIENTLAQTMDVPAKLDPDSLEKHALRLLDFAHQPCPPLPCGSDDAFIEDQAVSRLEAFAMMDAAAILRNREARRNAPNIHAFDEQYFSGE